MLASWVDTVLVDVLIDTVSNFGQANSLALTATDAVATSGDVSVPVADR